MNLYFQSIELSLAQKTSKSLESGNFTKFSLLPININFQLLIPVLGNKDKQLNKHLGKQPLASLRTHLSPFLVHSPLAACCTWSLQGGDGEGMGVGVLRLAFLCCSSFLTPWLPRWLQSPQGIPPPLSSFVQPPCLGNSSRVVFPSLLTRFSPGLLGRWWCSVCVTLLFLLLGFFNQSQ